MISKRIITHPILKVSKKITVPFYWNGTKLTGITDEAVSSALLANNIHIFGHHHKDNSPQGIFCANGQCSQCMVVINGVATKSCMTKLKKNMKIEPLNGLPTLKKVLTPPQIKKLKRHNTSVLIIGGGPAGLSAAIELGSLKIKTILIDDKNSLGGKLLLQTHKFFGSVKDSYAGIRGFEIANILEKKVRALNSVSVWLESTCVGIFSDKIIGVNRKGIYEEIQSDRLLITTGAREKMLSFPGNTLPGIYGAGAFQTLINRDLVKSSKEILIVGGGNVGLIAGYHAIQAGIKVIGLIEALPKTGGYKVHSDKLKRMGVPIFTNHTVVSAQGIEHVKSVTIAELNSNWQIKQNTQKTFNVDTILIAIGLIEINEFYLKAKQWNMKAYTAGDAKEIAEASSAIFNGKIEGLKIAQSLEIYKEDIPEKWNEKAIILKTKPSNSKKRKLIHNKNKIFPIFHCYQKIPCNPCTSVCPENAIKTVNNEIIELPYLEDNAICKGCMACITICPGLAITLIDYSKDNEFPTLTIPYEMTKSSVKKGDTVLLTNVEGSMIGHYEVKRTISNPKKHPGTLLIQIKIEKNIAENTVGIKIQEKQYDPLLTYENTSLPDEAIICRCERITASVIRKAIKNNNITDLNHLKAITRVGMGACGAKTCHPMIFKIFKEEGININRITNKTDRPLFVEVSMGAFVGVKGKLDE